MKKLLLSVSAFGIMALGAVNAQMVNKTPFVEHFTQASCGPCASQNPTMYTTLNTFGSSNYVKLTYQTSWPGVDPMNAAYPNGPASRVTYYSVSGVPNASLSGDATAGPNTAVTATTLANKAAEMTPYSIAISHSWTGTNSNDITVNIDVTNNTAASVSSADRIYVAMVEDEINYASAPGSNGETAFFYVLRQFYDASNGAALGATTGNGIALPAIGANSTQNYNFTISNANIPSYINDLNELNFVCFIQNNSTRAVEQSAKSTSGNVPGLLDVSTAANSTVGSGYCDYSFTPSVNFTNNGSTAVTSVTVEYTINGGSAVPQTFTGNLAQTQSTAITFPAVTLPSGTSTVQYTVTDVNNGGLYSAGPNTMAAETYAKMPANANTADVSEGFDGLSIGTDAPAGAIADNPNNIRAYTVDNNISTAVTWDLGGFGNSNGCFRWDYFAIPTSGGTSSLVWEKLDLTGKADYALTFSHAHALYAGTEPDQLKVNVSTDCGATWTTVWNKSGTNLATAPANASARFYPQANDWVSNTVDLSAYDNAPELLIQFEGISGYGNSLYVDDINTGSTTGINEDANTVTDVTLMPNPVVDNLTVNFTTENASANITVKNVQGQVVRNIAKNTVKGENRMEINTAELSAGVYFLTIASESNITTKRFVIKK